MINKQKGIAKTSALVIITIAILIGLVIFMFMSCTLLFKRGQNEVLEKTGPQELEQYDGKLLDIMNKNNTLEGKAVIVKEDNKLFANFTIIIQDSLPANHSSEICDSLDEACQNIDIDYYYVGTLLDNNNNEILSSPLNPLYCTSKNENINYFEDFSPICKERKTLPPEGLKTNEFAMGLGGNFSSISEVKNISKIDIHNAAHAARSLCEETGTLINCTRDIDTKKGKSGKIVKSYNISMTE